MDCSIPSGTPGLQDLQYVKFEFNRPLKWYLSEHELEYPHNTDGSSSKMKKFKCNAYQTIFVPLDSTIRMACIVYDTIPHTHPTLPLSKPSKVATELYRKCMQAAGVVGSTVQTVKRGMPFVTFKHWNLIVMP